MSSRKARSSIDSTANPTIPILPLPLTSPSIQDIPALTNHLRSQLKSYSSFTGTINNSLKDVHQLQSELDIDLKPINLVKGRLDRAYDNLIEQTDDEIRRIDQAIGSIDTLITLQTASESVVDTTASSALLPTPPSPLSSTQPLLSSSAKPIRGPYRKRKFDGTSSNPSPLPSSSIPSPQGSPIILPRQAGIPLHSPALSATTSVYASSPIALTLGLPPTPSPVAPPALGLPPLNVTLGHHLSRNSENSLGAIGLGSGIGTAAIGGSSGSGSNINYSHSIPTSSGTTTTTTNHSKPPGIKKVTAKSRKEHLMNQLPLSEGRQVVFKIPIKGVQTEPKKEEWILARIVGVISGDKNRYVVDDVDYDPLQPSTEGGRFSTTIKSIIPLPDSKDRLRTFPEQDFAPGLQVMALYPDTTAFYRAQIVSGPELLVEKVKGKKDVNLWIYRVKFEDDGDQIWPISVELVVEQP